MAANEHGKVDGDAAGRAGPSPGGKDDLLMRFFESDFFDSWIAVTYLHKNLSPALHEYLCNRLFALPESDVERFLSQLCELCVSRQDATLSRVLVQLCAQSLRIAVKTYWLLLAISQDNPRNAHVASLRDACEQAALEGHWDLPFKDAKLPAPSSRKHNRFLRLQQLPPPDGLAASAPISTPGGGAPHASPSLSVSLSAHASEDAGWDGAAQSPEIVSRPMSPDGLGDGIFSSVFMDTGVEGLIYGGSSPPEMHEHSLRGESSRATFGTASPPQSRTPLHGGAGGEGEASPLLSPLRTGAPGEEEGTVEGASPPYSPPTSPRRRETTFGATLDFVEALCTTSSNLTAFQPEDRAWALQKALLSINTEIERASAAGVAIWFPMGRAAGGGCGPGGCGQRVVRLACKESRLLNSREKAPFTLYVEVLTEAPPSPAATPGGGATPDEGSAPASPAAEPAAEGGEEGEEGAGRGAERAALDAAAAEAAAGGIAWVPHHHRRSSSQDTTTSSTLSTLAAAAVAAVQGSSAAAARAATPPPAADRAPPAGGEGRGTGPHTRVPSWDLQHPPMAAGLPAGAHFASPSLLSQRSEASTLATDLSMADFASEASHSPPARRPHSGGGEDGALAAGGGGGGGGGARREPTPGSSSLPPLPPGHVQGGGTWIGGHLPRPSAPASQASPTRPPPPFQPADLSSGLSAALAGLRGLGPAVTVRLEVLNDVPAPPASRAASDSSSVSVGSDATAAGGEAPPPGSVRRNAVMPLAPGAPGAAPQAACSRTGWLCKLGLCKACNAAVKAAPAAAAAAPPPPVAPPAPTQPPTHVKLELIVQRSLDLAVRPAHAGSRHRRMPSHEALLQVARQHQLPPPHHLALRLPAPAPAPAPAATPPPASPAATPRGGGSPQAAAARRREAEALYGEPWEARRARLRHASPHGRRPGWDLRAVIVKSGDDCRQELLAMQLISTFHDIFAEARLPLWLRPYEVLVTSSLTALIEMVPDAPSVHAVKAAGAPEASLRDHLAAKFGEGSPAHKRAQRNFVESLAASSLVCYLLQIKDRHNGNILLDAQGRLVHIDFGFMLSNSPGGVNFESAPFKLTRELLEVMESGPEGRPSELFDYFKVLVIQGFLAARRHSDRIEALVEMMAGSGCPCFKNRVAAVQGLRRRFAPGLAEPAVVEVVLGLISDSLDAWRTRQYDYYQRVLNGIL